MTQSATAPVEPDDDPTAPPPRRWLLRSAAGLALVAALGLGYTTGLARDDSAYVQIDREVSGRVVVVGNDRTSIALDTGGASTESFSLLGGPAPQVGDAVRGTVVVVRVGRDATEEGLILHR